MMNSKKIIGLGILIWITVFGFGQGRKTIREKGIVSMTVQEYFIEEGMKDPIIETIEKYSEEGKLAEIQKFNRRGEVKRWEKYGYDEEGNLVEEVFLDEKGKILRTEKSVYEDGLRVEKQFFNNREKLYKKKVYKYEYQQEH